MAPEYTNSRDSDNVFLLSPKRDCIKMSHEKARCKVQDLGRSSVEVKCTVNNYRLVKDKYLK